MKISFQSSVGKGFLFCAIEEFREAVRIFMGLKPSISQQRFGVKVDSVEGEQEGAVYSRGSCVKNDAKVE